MAAVTAARTAPNQTMLSEGVVLKFVPVIVTGVPTGPEVGVKEVIEGGWAFNVPTVNAINAEKKIFKKKDQGERLFIRE